MNSHPQYAFKRFKVSTLLNLFLGINYLVGHSTTNNDISMLHHDLFIVCWCVCVCTENRIHIFVPSVNRKINIAYSNANKYTRRRDMACLFCRPLSLNEMSVVLSGGCSVYCPLSNNIFIANRL